MLQFALPATATYGDARLEREGVTAQAHAESRSDASCRPVHAAECALCQLVSRASMPTVHDHGYPAIVGVIEQPDIAERPWRALRGSARLSLPRAPPVS